MNQHIFKDIGNCKPYLAGTKCIKCNIKISKSIISIKGSRRYGEMLVEIFYHTDMDDMDAALIHYNNFLKIATHEHACLLSDKDFDLKSLLQ